MFKDQRLNASQRGMSALMLRWYFDTLFQLIYLGKYVRPLGVVRGMIDWEMESHDLLSLIELVSFFRYLKYA